MINFWRLVVKIDRYTQWVLLVLVLVFIITGYGMTKQIIDPVLATRWHINILPIPLFIFLGLHILPCLKRFINFFK